MSSTNNQQPDWRSGPTEREIESKLTTIKPRPTARLNEMMRQAPWQIEEQGTDMIYLKRLNFIGVGAALMLLVVVTAVIISQWPAREETTAAAPIPTRESNELPTEVPLAETQPAWTANLFGADNQPLEKVSGLVFGGEGADGRLFIAAGEAGIQIHDAASGERLDTIEILDPETGTAVFVRDLVWSQLLWLGPPESGLIVLTDPFQDGSYLHVVDPADGAVLQSFELNSNIAIPANAEPIQESVPTQLAASGSGELYLNRTFTFPAKTAGGPTVDYHYLLRATIDGRILNPMLVYQTRTDEARPTVIDALAYQAGTEDVYAAVNNGSRVTVQKYNLIGQPGQEDIPAWTVQSGSPFFSALSSDPEGHVYYLMDPPAQVVEFGEASEMTRVYAFHNEDVEPTGVYEWLADAAGRPMALAVSLDGSMLYVVGQNKGQLILAAYPLGD